jgi:hypothetical protein
MLHGSGLRPLSLLERLPFHHPVRRVAAFVLHGPAYAAIRDRCLDVEPDDESTRRSLAHAIAVRSVIGVKALNGSNTAVTAAPLVGPQDTTDEHICGVVVAAGRPYRDGVACSDLVVRGRVYHHVVLYDGAAFIEFFVPSGMEPANVHQDYSVSKSLALSVVAAAS